MPGVVEMNAYTDDKPKDPVATDVASIRMFVIRYVRVPWAEGSAGTPRKVMEFSPGPPGMP